MERNAEGSPTKVAGKPQLHLRMTYIPAAGVPPDAVSSPAPVRNMNNVFSPSAASPDTQVGAASVPCHV
jgi:hypothetical protein